MFRYFGTSQNEPYHSPDNNIDLVQLAIQNFFEECHLITQFRR